MKTAISVPDETFTRVDAAARELGMSRSEFFSRAAKRWLEDLADETTTEEIDRAIAGTDADSTFVERAARSLVDPADDW